jgi:hypothetical protein
MARDVSFTDLLNITYIQAKITSALSTTLVLLIIWKGLNLSLGEGK